MVPLGLQYTVKLQTNQSWETEVHSSPPKPPSEKLNVGSEWPLEDQTDRYVNDKSVSIGENKKSGEC